MSEKADIKALAIAAWRLEKWLDELDSDRKMAAKSALRSIKKFIADSGVEVKDPVGSRFDPGLAVAVVNNEAGGESEESLIITQTLSPYIYRDGELIQHARVIIGVAGRDANAAPGAADEPPAAPGARTGGSKPEGGPGAQPTAAETQAAQETGEELTISADEMERIMEYAKIL